MVPKIAGIVGTIESIIGKSQIQVLYKVTEGICEKGFCSWDTRFFIPKNGQNPLFTYKNVFISGTKAFSKIASVTF